MIVLVPTLMLWIFALAGMTEELVASKAYIPTVSPVTLSSASVGWPERLSPKALATTWMPLPPFHVAPQ